MASPASRRSTASNSLIQLIESQGDFHSSTIITDVIKDLVRNVSSPERTSIILKECASAAKKYNEDLSYIIQQKSSHPPYDSPLFQVIMRTSVTDRVSLDILLLFLEYASSNEADLNVADIRHVCIVKDDQPLFEYIKAKIFVSVDIVYLSRTNARDEVVVQPRITNPERISSSGGNQPMFTADFTIPMFQTRMRGSNQVKLEFIAQGRMWCLAFHKSVLQAVVPRKSLALSRLWRRDRSNADSPAMYYDWQISLSLTDNSELTPVQALLTFSSSTHSPGGKDVFELELSTGQGKHLVSKVSYSYIKGVRKEDLGNGCLKIFASLNSGILSSSGSPYIEEDGSLVGTLEAILTMAEKPRKQKSMKRVAKATLKKADTDTASVCQWHSRSRVKCMRLSRFLKQFSSSATQHHTRISSMPSKAQSSFNGYDLEDLLPRWLQNAYTTPHIQSALTALDEREDARSSFRAESVQSLMSKNADQHLTVNANRPVGEVKGIKAKAAAATEAISSHLHNSDPNTASSESTKFYSIVSGISPDNMRRNRYMDVLPYDRTRVQVKVPHFRDSGALSNEDEELDGLYLNANWVQEKYGRKWWIASQAPLRNTAYTFLSLLLEDMYPPKPHSRAPRHSRPRTVVQLTQNIESGRRKAHPYFPDVVGQTMIVVPDFTDYPSSSTSTSHLRRSKLKVTLVAQERIGEACCVKSLVEVRPFVDHGMLDEDSDKDSDDLPLQLRPSSGPSAPPSATPNTDSDSDNYGDSYDSSSNVKATSKNTTPAAIRFTHLLFNAWPDHSVPSPSDRAALFEFVRLVDRVNRQMPSGSSSGQISAGSSKDTKDNLNSASNERSSTSEERDLDPDPPIIVGCSAGIGRTGSFIAMNSLLRHAGFLPPPGYSTTSESHSAAPQQLTQSPSIPSGPATPSEPSAPSLTTPLGPLPTTLSTDLVSQEIDSLREQRAGMVQRPEQAVLVYEMMVGAYVERGELKR
ncbi:hypothetical protein GGU10DRAFT_435377 [Lentinula aff. detonsa]|uniref:Phosphatases II n=1 Tax=Lentinula aff. detonsa TaxID=2804958 RepID=A0AA38KYW0_9AGAR|nr:hypothetical protein GGU10DRAFT_435377 [Lentinula aff. detonsa]